MISDEDKANLCETTDHLDFYLARLKPTKKQLGMGSDYYAFGQEKVPKKFNTQLKMEVNGKQISVYELYIMNQRKISVFNEQIATMLANNL